MQMKAPKFTETEMRELYSRAKEAGVRAGRAHTPTPMVVTQHCDPFNDHSPVVFRDVVSDGACGFAWVKVMPGNSRFARWLVRNSLAVKSYDGGVDIRIHDHGQSLERKEAHARAMRDVLRAAGIECYMDSRMD